MLNYLKYSGIWCGLVVNPYHWEWGCRQDNVTDDIIFSITILAGPIWIKLTIDDGKW